MAFFYYFSISKTKVVVARIRTFLRWIYNAAMQWKKFIIFFNFIYYIFIILIIKIKVLILASFVLWKKWIKIEPNIENYRICDIEKDSPFWKTKNNLCFYELNSIHLQTKNERVWEKTVRVLLYFWDLMNNSFFKNGWNTCIFQ